jgi:hypothetical protein
MLVRHAAGLFKAQAGETGWHYLSLLRRFCLVPTGAKQIAQNRANIPSKIVHFSLHPPNVPLSYSEKMQRFLNPKNFEDFQVERGQKDSSSISVRPIYEQQGWQHSLQIPKVGAHTS